MQRELNLSQIESLLRANHVQFAGIFGSFARGDARETSDVDILVRFSKTPSLLGLIRLEREIAEKIGRKVDLVIEDTLDDLMRDEVMSDLKPLYGERQVV